MEKFSITTIDDNILKKIKYFDVRINKYTPLKDGSYVEFISRKTAILNIKDNEWSVVFV